MPEATEIVYLVLREGFNPEEAGSPAAQQLKKCATTLGQQKGFIRSYWGVKVEDPKTFVWTIDWDDVEDHKNFVNSEAYSPFTGDLAELFDFSVAAPHFYHVNFPGDSLAAREAPVTEFAPFNVTLASSDDAKSKLEDALLDLSKFVKDFGADGTAVGWAIEEQDHPDAPEGKTKLLQALIGWENIEAHMDARSKPEFMKSIQPVRELTIPAPPGKTVFHVKLHGKK